MRESLEIGSVRTRLLARTITATALIDQVLTQIREWDDPAIWIFSASNSVVRGRARELDALALTDPRAIEKMPLFGIPFAVKDNIDVAGMPTTAGCPAFAYTAEETAPVVAHLIEAGAILLGKTNLDQFATGLVGTRSPYGVPRNPFDARFIPGGSSSGSAGGRRGRPSQLCARHRHRRIGPGSRCFQQHCRAEANPRSPQPPRRRSGVPVARLRLDIYIDGWGRSHRVRCGGGI